jgi:hypothetical protein
MYAEPEMMTTAATDLATIGSDLHAAHTAAAIPTVSLIPAAADEVSAAIASVFSGHGQGFQALAAQASVFHGQFVQNLKAGAGAYSAAEAHTAAGLPDYIGNYFLGLLELPFTALAQGDWAGFLQHLLLLPVGLIAGVAIFGFLLAPLIFLLPLVLITSFIDGLVGYPLL